MSEPTVPAAADEKPTAYQIEAEIAETRERLADSVDQLAAKLDVKAQAQEKVQQTKDQAQEKVAQTRDQVVAGSKSLLDRFLALSRPVQASIGAVPVALLLLVIVRRARQA